MKYFIITILGFLACSHIAYSGEDNWLVIQGKQVGVIKSNWTLEDIKKNFERPQYSFQEVDVGEGETAPMLIIFPDTPNQLIISYRGNKLISATIRGQGSNWITDDGVQIGTSITEVERINGGAFTVSGWGWDYPGVMYSNNGGNYTGPSLSFTYAGGEITTSDFLGEQGIITSSLPGKDNAGVYEMVVYLE